MDIDSRSSNDGIAWALIVPHIILSVIATVSAGAKLHFGRASGARFSAADGVCLAALFSNHALLITEGASVHFGLGKDVATVGASYPGGIPPVLKGITAMGIVYGIACPLSKLAVFATYFRLCSDCKVLRICVWILSFMVLAWGIAVILGTLFRCTPVQGFWDKTIPSICYMRTEVSIAIPNIFINALATVLLLVGAVCQLEFGRERNLALATVLLFGTGIVAASIVRPILFHVYRLGSGASNGGNATNISRVNVYPYIGSSIETCLAIIATSLPVCAQLLKRHICSSSEDFSRSKSIDCTSQRSGHSRKAHSVKLSTYSNSTRITIGNTSKTRNTGGVLAACVKHKRPRELGSDADIEGSFERLEDGPRSSPASTDVLYSDSRDLGSIEGIQVQREFHIQVDRESRVTTGDIKNWVVGDIALKELPSPTRKMNN
ncbi:hypothetical protein CGLO_10511 [Colletotrichum gloeosporioides Cg-14]|uniref:Rhodopsin domain-containing protein n=1 Tax=Colletotrichum gloeosporioides (strain Cg-14) TaxID=1237896 RepID=T0LEU5_COLGC|nr:hypothetical protein CGLO_10511 [Colletotrichum gloeosporioides Cg-14]